jgi:hypothetical protein
MVEVKWLPPRSLAARTEWAKSHPWIAGCYFGLLLGLVATVTSLFAMAALWAVFFGLVLGLAAGLLFAIGLRLHERLERPSPGTYPPPTMRRPWSRASDRFVSVFMWLGLVGGVSGVGKVAAHLVGAGGFGAGAGGVFTSLFGLAASIWIFTTTYLERRHRRSESEGSASA